MTLRVGGSAKVSGVRRFLRATVTLADADTPVSLGTLPAGSTVVDCFAVVTQEFNDTGSDFISVGDAAGAHNDITSNINPVNVGLKSTSASNVTSSSALVYETATEVFALYNPANSDGTTGSAIIFLEYVTS